MKMLWSGVKRPGKQKSIWNPDETSPQLQNRVSVAPQKGLMPSKNFKKRAFESDIETFTSGWHVLYAHAHVRGVLLRTLINRPEMDVNGLIAGSFTDKTLLRIAW